MAVLFVPNYFQPQDNNGALLPGGKVYTYAAGTTTNKATYTDASGTTAATNPITLDAGGKATIWLDGAYKFVVTSADGSFTVTTDNVTSFVPGGNSSIDINGLTITTPDYVDFAPIYDVSAAGNRKTTLSTVLGLLPSYISGFMPQGASGTASTANLVITLGVATSSNVPDVLQAPNLSWAVSNGNNINGDQGGNTLPNSSNIHFFVCKGATGTGSFASLSLTPTLPTGYDLAYRRVFSLKTTAAGAIIPVTALEAEGGSIISYLTTPTNDYNASITTTAVLIPLNVPGGIVVQPIMRPWSTTSTATSMVLTSPVETDVAPSAVQTATGNGYDLASNANFAGFGGGVVLTTDTSGQIRARATASMNLNITTRGWKDFRR